MTTLRITWYDSGMHLDEGWATADKYTEDIDLDRLLVVTVGMLMHEDDDVVVLGLSYDPAHENWYGAQLIMKLNIQKREVLL